MASYRGGGGVLFRTAGAREIKYSCRSLYSFALTVYLSALRRMGSMFSGLLGDDDEGVADDIMALPLCKGRR